MDVGERFLKMNLVSRAVAIYLSTRTIRFAQGTAPGSVPKTAAAPPGVLHGIFFLMTAFLLMSVLAILIGLFRNKNWKLAAALTDREKPSSSRIAAMLGVIVVSTVTLEAGYSCVWRLLSGQDLPSGIRFSVAAGRSQPVRTVCCEPNLKCFQFAAARSWSACAHSSFAIWRSTHSSSIITNGRLTMTSSLTKEIRFAVVMYGGISLAVYINGVAIELLNLVRATSSGRQPQDRPGTSEVYKAIAQTLAETEGFAMRFVVDIIAGTSAGGINGIFLAKALANDQSMRKVHDLWIQQADISALLNDKRSTKDMKGRIAPQKQPESLLNSERIYLNLLDAFNGMGPDSSDDRHFSDLRELDLYVTATDIWGEVLPLRLHDKFVWEKRYKAVFHLTYRDSGARQDTSCAKTPAPQYRRNDFVKENNPFLAFASRATSSFPFAFQPMTLRDLQKLVRVRDGFTKEQLEEKLKEWKALFFSNPEQPKKGAAPWTDPADRPYSDGGCLDNKPFSHVTRALLQRAADVAVERKLLYVEPSPEHPEEIGPPRDRDGRVIPPDAIENSIRALIVLPADETIREDLERILDRNKGIERLNRLIRAIESDVFDVNGGDAERQSRIEKAQTRWENCSGAELSDTAKRADQWASRGLKVRSKPQDEVEQEQPKDARYSAYTRLKVSTVTDELAILISQLAGFDTESHESLAVRCLVKTWRDDRYSDVEGERTLGHFLLSFDCAYRLRRLQFVLRRIDDLLRSDRNDALNRLIRLVWPKEPESSARDVKDWNKEQHRRFKEELSKLRGCIGCALQILQTGLKILHTPRRKQSTLKLYKVVIATEHESVLQAVEALPLRLVRNFRWNS